MFRCVIAAPLCKTLWRGQGGAIMSWKRPFKCDLIDKTYYSIQQELHIAGFEIYEHVALLCSSTFCQAGVIFSIVKVSHTVHKKKRKFSHCRSSDLPFCI